MGIGPSTRANHFLFSAQLQLLGQRQVALIIIPTQVSKQPTTLANQLQQASPAGLIVLMRTQMVSQLEDAAGQDGHLDLRRTGVGFMAVVIRDDLGFDFLVKRHDVCYPFFNFFEQVSSLAGLAAGGTSQCGRYYIRYFDPESRSLRSPCHCSICNIIIEMTLMDISPNFRIPLELIRLLRLSRNITVLTGAGVSAESGLRTFREVNSSTISEQPLWSQYRPEDLATPEAFERNPELVWEFYAMRRLKADEVKPNPGHIALMRMEFLVPHFTLVTQNVDGLHQRAGSKRVIELHGNITRVRCSLGCSVFTEWEDIPGRVPTCPKCGANLRPDVVWFGEMLPRNELETALESARTCQIFFSIGTSSLVEPAASLARHAGQRGAIVVEVNTEKTSLTSSADYFLQGKSGQVLPELVKETWG
jgi:NAD-dependent deacetylase